MKHYNRSHIIASSPCFWRTFIIDPLLRIRFSRPASEQYLPPVPLYSVGDCGRTDDVASQLRLTLPRFLKLKQNVWKSRSQFWPMVSILSGMILERKSLKNLRSIYWVDDRYSIAEGCQADLIAFPHLGTIPRVPWGKCIVFLTIWCLKV